MKKTQKKSQKSQRGKNKKKLVVSGGQPVEVRASGELNRINEHAAGIDIGSDQHYVAVPPGSTEHSVRVFGVFTMDLYAIADWLKECGVVTVAMESTGVYWVPLYEVLEELGFQVKLVDARKVKNVSGRKSDVLDCQWIQQLESYGLLKPAYRPDDEIVILRSYVRQREMLVKGASPHIQHMQKALQQMNLRLDNVVSDITGQTGMKIIKAIIDGERDSEKLAKMRDFRCKATEEEIAQSLIGNFRPEHLFSLKQGMELFEYYQTKILECEAEIEKYLESLPHVTEEVPETLTKKQNRMSFNAQDQIYKMFGIDLFRVTGLNSETLLRIVSEVGVDMSSFPDNKNFASWLCLSPNRRISGGRVLSSHTNPSSNRAAAAFIQAAVSVQRTKTELGAFYRRIRSQKGPASAATATAHKIARIYYSLVKYGTEYQDEGAKAYEERERERKVASLKKRAREFGFELVEKAA